MTTAIEPTYECCTGPRGQNFEFYEAGSGSVPVVLLHGLFGSPSNWRPIMCELAEYYRFLALQLPIDLNRGRGHAAFKSIGQLTEYVEAFFQQMQLKRAVFCGNSLGGQVTLDFFTRNPQCVEKLILSGSAGLFERSLSGGRMPRVCRQFIRDQACQIFYDPAHVTDQLVEEMFAMLSDRKYRRFLLKVAKASRDRHMLADLPNVHVPTMLIWGRNDAITPPHVAEEFCDHLPRAELALIDHCGHSPPIEQPDTFAQLLHGFLSATPSDRHWTPCKPR